MQLWTRLREHRARSPSCTHWSQWEVYCGLRGCSHSYTLQEDHSVCTELSWRQWSAVQAPSVCLVCLHGYRSRVRLWVVCRHYWVIHEWTAETGAGRVLGADGLDSFIWTSSEKKAFRPSCFYLFIFLKRRMYFSAHESVHLVTLSTARCSAGKHGANFLTQLGQSTSGFTYNVPTIPLPCLSWARTLNCSSSLSFNI